LGKEAAKVGTTLGYTLEPLFGLTAEDFLGPKDEELKGLLLSIVKDVGKESRTCILQDLLKKRLTEVGYLNGLIVKKGREVNVPTPLNEAVASIVNKIEEGKLEMGLSNLEILEQYA
jgi:hypothetical protein